MAARVCPFCHGPCKDTDLFCRHCGEELGVTLHKPGETTLEPPQAETPALEQDPRDTQQWVEGLFAGDDDNPPQPTEPLPAPPPEPVPPPPAELAPPPPAELAPPPPPPEPALERRVETLKCMHCQGEVTTKSRRARFCPTCGTKRGSSTPPGEGERRVVMPRMESPSTEWMTCPACTGRSRVGRSYCIGCGARFEDPEVVVQAALAAAEAEVERTKTVTLGTAEYLGGGEGWAPDRYKDELAFTPERVRFGTKDVAAMVDVASVEIVGDQQAKSKTGATVLFGASGGLAAKGAIDRTEIGVHLKSGAVPYFRVLKKNRIQVRSNLGPVLNEAEVPFLDEVMLQGQQPETSPMDEIEKAFELFKAGALTEEEFKAAKERLLG